MRKQRNVEDLNAKQLALIRAAAESFRSSPSDFSWLISVLISHGLNPERGILAAIYDISEPAGWFYRGIWLTDAGQFWEFEATIGRQTDLLEEGRLSNVTLTMPVDPYRKDAGQSFGDMALMVRDELRRSPGFLP